MTLDEYMAGGTEHYELQHECACNLLDDAIGRLADMTADRDSWMDQCMDARRVWHEDHQRLELVTKAHRMDCDRLMARIAELQAERDNWESLAKRPD
jgi:hypothetical protein